MDFLSVPVSVMTILEINDFLDYGFHGKTGLSAVHSTALMLFITQGHLKGSTHYSLVDRVHRSIDNQSALRHAYKSKHWP